MPASLKFESVSGTAATADLSDAKIAIYEDEGGNKYTLDFTSITGLTKIDDIKLSTLKYVAFKYHPSGGSDATVTGLGNIIGALFATKTTSKSAPILQEKVAEKDVVKAILAAEENSSKIVETELANTFAKKTDLAAKVDLDATNLTEDKVEKMLKKITTADKKVVQVSDLGTKPTAEALLGAKDGEKLVLVTKLAEALDQTTDPTHKVYGTHGQEKIAKAFLGEALLGAQDAKKSILVTELGKALDRTGDNADDKVYGQPGGLKIAKDFLGEKGLKPTAAEVAGVKALQDAVAGNSDFQNAVKSSVTIAVNADNADFQGAVHKIMSSDYISDDPSHWDF